MFACEKDEKSGAAEREREKIRENVKKSLSRLRRFSSWLGRSRLGRSWLGRSGLGRSGLRRCTEKTVNVFKKFMTN
jgi:DNA invertase Pin-like site-specific DNA recombinase